MKVDTLDDADLHLMMEMELVCQWCEAPAEYMWRHGSTNHFNCGDCAEENMGIIEEMILEGSTHGWCVGCKVEIDITFIRFVKI
jgi:hypothetical protein